MKYAVSACLLGINCKYNGGNNLHQPLMEYLKDKEVLPVCPEMFGGLPSPRPCCELCDGKVVTRQGEDVTEAFEKGAAIAVEKLKQFEADMVILQPRSPSCGSSHIYSGMFDGKLVDGSGLFARKLQEQGISAMDVDDFMQMQKKKAKIQN